MTECECAQVQRLVWDRGTGGGGGGRNHPLHALAGMARGVRGGRETGKWRGKEMLQIDELQQEAGAAKGTAGCT